MCLISIDLPTALFSIGIVNIKNCLFPPCDFNTYSYRRTQYATPLKELTFGVRLAVCFLPATESVCSASQIHAHINKLHLGVSASYFLLQLNAISYVKIGKSEEK